MKNEEMIKWLIMSKKLPKNGTDVAVFCRIAKTSYTAGTLCAIGAKIYVNYKNNK
ncbi:hypothetical protein FACS189430_05410 [Bacteroidia bacterium]|nr:hypothetical protein FACS189430_05410 [Bacteroidia bacterium]